MHRRSFLVKGSAAVLSSWGPLAKSAAHSRDITVTVNMGKTSGTIASNFLGLGYEISSVAIPGLLSAQNRTYVQLVRTLSPQGVVRVGGNTSDDASFAPNGKAVSAPKGTVVTKASLQQLGSFLGATDWQLIWGLNLGSTDEQQAVAEAEAVADAAKNHLLAFEIGNEPDLFGRGAAHRSNTYDYENYLEEFRRYKSAIRRKLPRAPFAGPDVASATNWVERFARDEGKDLKLLTHHYYRECANPNSTLEKLLRPDPKLGPELAALQQASSTYNLPYRICETNSFCSGGKPGVSDTFGAALWVLDFLFKLASARCAGVNMETGVNQLGFISSYSPIRTDEQNNAVAAPEYYGMLAFAQASGGKLVAVDCDAAGANISAHAVAGESRTLCVTVINKEPALDINVTLRVPESARDAHVLRLSAESLEATSGVALGNSLVSSNGTWQPQGNERLGTNEGRTAIHIPAASAAIMRWPPS